MKTYNLKKNLFLNKYRTNPYVHCSYSDAQRRTVVREFVRLFYGFDKGKILTFIIVNYKYKLTLSSHGRRGFLTSPMQSVQVLSKSTITRHAFNVNVLCIFTKRNSLHLGHSSHIVGVVFNHEDIVGGFSTRRIP